MSAERLNILLVEDNPGDARLFKEALNEAHVPNYVLLHCTSLAQALDRLPTPGRMSSWSIWACRMPSASM